MTLGTEGRPSEPGAPFNQPTDVAVSPSGEIFVSDGYGQSRVHKFASESRFSTPTASFSLGDVGLCGLLDGAGSGTRCGSTL